MKPGMTASELYDAYTGFGDDPFIVCVNSDDERVRFSSWDYAKEQSRLDSFSARSMRGNLLVVIRLAT